MFAALHERRDWQLAIGQTRTLRADSHSRLGQGLDCLANPRRAGAGDQRPMTDDRVFMKIHENFETLLTIPLQFAMIPLLFGMTLLPVDVLRLGVGVIHGCGLHPAHRSACALRGWNCFPRSGPKLKLVAQFARKGMRALGSK